MKEQHTKKQHYVPRFLLRFFSYDKKHVYVLDRYNSNKIYASTTNCICYEDDIYDVKWIDANEELGEYVLDNQLENSFASNEYKASLVVHKIIQEIKEGKRRLELVSEEQDILLEFITTLYLRNPYVLEDILTVYNDVENEEWFEAAKFVTNFLFAKARWGKPTSLIEFSKKKGIFNKDVEDSIFNLKYEALSKFPYIFWHSSKGGFVTSSFPLYFHEDDEKIKYIMCPLSSEVAIVFLENNIKDIKKGTVIETESSDVKVKMKEYFCAYPCDMARLFIAKDKEILRELIE